MPTPSVAAAHTRRGRVSGARRDESRLVRVDDRLDAVAQSELPRVGLVPNVLADGGELTSVQVRATTVQFL
jgi:hypothetical protein